MIPKIIHYCWFGRNPLPKTVQKCIATWKAHLATYEFRLWDETNSPMDHPFVKEAYAAKKYAFVADYVRLWALYNEGGIYLDTDMFVVKNFDSLLIENIFMGYEDKLNKYINGAIIGTQLNNSFIYQLIANYDFLRFDKNNVEDLKIPRIITNTYASYENKQSIKILPFDYFYPFPFEKRNDKNEFLNYMTKNTYAIHLWDLSWFTWKDYLIYRFSGIRRKLMNYLENPSSKAET